MFCPELLFAWSPLKVRSSRFMRRKENDHKPVVPSLHRGPVLCERRQLSRTEKPLRSILEATPEVYGIWNRSSGPIQLNEGHLALLGYSEAYSSKRRVFLHSQLHADDRADFATKLDAYLAGKTSLLHCEFRLRTKAGQYRWFQLRGQTVCCDRGAGLEMAYSLRDIHPRKKQDEEMPALLGGFMAILQASRDIICVVEPAEFRLIAFNRSFEDTIFRTHGIRVRPGLRPEDIDPQQAASWNAFYRQVLAEGNVTRDFKIAGLTEIHHIYAQTLDRDGRVYGICVLGHDVRKGNQLEAALRRSEEKFERAFRETPLALALTSLRDHRYLDVNDAYSEATGYSREELIGKTPSDIGL
jgi:PAS domain S-box-containing protein